MSDDEVRHIAVDKTAACNNAADLRDPEALDKLAWPQTISCIAFTTYIVRT